MPVFSLVEVFQRVNMVTVQVTTRLERTCTTAEELVGATVRISSSLNLKQFSYSNIFYNSIGNHGSYGR